MGEPVKAGPVMLIMAALLSFFIYIFLIPEYPFYPEYDNYVPNIMEVQEVEVESELRAIVGTLIVVALPIALLVWVKIYNYRMEKKYPESSPAPEEEDSAERNE